MSDNYAGLLLITYNDKENLEKMLPSFIETLDYPTALHIIDMGSTDGTTDLLYTTNFYDSAYVTSVNIECRKELKSLAETMNHGFLTLMSRQECELIGWVHSDAAYKNNWLSQLVATLQHRPDIGKLCSHNTRDGLPRYDQPAPGHEQIYLVRRGVLLQVGLFDENFIGIGGFEDLDLNRRIIQEGWKVAISPTSLVNHAGMGTRSKRDTSEEQRHNKGVYFNKWGDVKDGEMFV